MIAALTDPEKMETVYLSLNEARDPIDVLMASTTMPFFATPQLCDGRIYYDANIICAIPLRYLEKVEEIEETWVILTTPHGYRRQAWRWQMASWFVKDRRIKKLLSNRAITENQVLDEIERRSDLFVIRPERSLPIHWRDSSQDGIKQAIELGRKAVRKTLTKRKETYGP
ncbi:MAG: hypothetical protein A2431_03450 [Candidatus Zambryskibacteria bacterium RIFOXYC1_FULL_39_10]|uniref:PNPLA domain-containing protein n=1 Tax=Candidatus Zambryskibacteria bacterium RIFOXYC1_FULL_39_10 TaxID=1802779 RepID=A0A1G2UZB9_9BACT|nr:MAG: hypothetical protein A2431_03450 [Candidatus Zambryskibacteria bacterium RIFOXYC1_FULL_39_10]OHB16929.1 MAG: hypothetical protein A2605_00485 [Candidatus Zambryskibacteria bacterium RIFOXYD1_FULL_39_35]